MTDNSLIALARRRFHKTLLDGVLHLNNAGVATNADKDSRLSRGIASGVLNRLAHTATAERLPGQTSGHKFESVCESFLQETFQHLSFLRPGTWEVERSSGGRLAIAKFEQYQHLAELEAASKADPILATVLGNEYLIRPDIVVCRYPEDDAEINKHAQIVGDEFVKYASLRKANNELPILHASISCKWTLRSDRAQNARSEGLNLVRNRKGRLPHFVAITGEPMPSRIASLALGTGDVDCVYHIALPELKEAVAELDYQDAQEMLSIMIEGKRLRDISDLPLDLAI